MMSKGITAMNVTALLLFSLFLCVKSGNITTNTSTISKSSQSSTPKFKFEPRIIGGENALPGKFSYIVSIQLKEPRQHFCGGSIITPTYILTAAHCFRNLPASVTLPDGIVVWAGGINLRELESGVTREVAALKSYLIEYNPNDHDNDIAILQLKEKLEWSDNVKPIKLIDTSVSTGSEVLVAGWGFTVEGQRPSLSLDLLFVNIFTTDIESCKEDYQAELTLTSNMLCAQYKGEKPKDPCLGDSGGPLTYDGQQIGIVSFGMGCGRENYPGVYTNVVPYKDWVKEITSSGTKSSLSYALISISIIFTANLLY